MKTKAPLFVCCALLWTLMPGMVHIPGADDHSERHRERTHEERDARGHEALRPVSNPVYREGCGACHFAYQPELLPSASWKKLVTAHDDHFGESVALDDDSEKTILDYLTANGAEKSSAERAVKIMRSLGSDVPSRITDIPYIQRKHRKISSSVLKHDSIGSLSNCTACHKTAEEGIYEDDNVSIPK
jgi:hypothetical protein